MDDRRQTLSQALAAVVLHTIVVPILFWSVAIAVIVAPGIFAVPSGIVFIWLVVRWSNHHDDPRHQKPPPDPP
jgi:hypothetical protein